MSGGTNPFADNGQGALQPFTAPWFDYYSEIPFCGDICIAKVYGCMDSNVEAILTTVDSRIMEFHLIWSQPAKR